MKNSPLVSVIVPVYNVERYVAAALDSVVNQTYGNLDIIVIDDGSRDSSGEICERYGSDERVRVVRQSNKGLSAARNAGLDMMRGDLVVFLDSDDAYRPDYVEKMVEVKLRESPELAVCGFLSYETDGEMNEQNLLDERSRIVEGTYDRAGALRALADGAINHIVWNKIYDSKLFDGVRFPVGHVYEDVEVMFRILDKCEKVVVFRDELYMRRKHPGSITTTDSAKNVSDRILAQSHFNEFIDNNTPEIFSKEQVVRARRSWVSRMMNYFGSMKGKENKEIREKLREQITSDGGKADIKNGWFRLRAAYLMIRRCPWLFRAVFPLYSFVLTRIRKK